MSELVEFDSESDGPGVVVLEAPDDGAFWELVEKDAIDREWAYGLDEAASVDASPLIDDEDQYIWTEVATWLREHIAPPQWHWFTWVNDEYEEGRQILDPCEATEPGAFLGAVIHFRDVAS